MNHKDQTFVIKFPAIEKTTSQLTANSTEEPGPPTEATPEYVVSIPTGGNTSYLLFKSSEISNDPDFTAKAALSSLTADYAESHELILLSVLRAVDGLKGSQNDRLRVVSLRVQCLLIITHSRLSHELLHPYIKAGSTVLRDLISLSDISSESFSALQLEPSSLSAVNLILNCVLGILEFNLRRRGPLLAGILLELGLTRAGTSAPAPLPFCLSACLSVALSVCSSSLRPICLSVALSVCLSVLLPSVLSVCLLLCLSAYPRFYMFVPSVCLSVSLYIFLLTVLSPFFPYIYF